VGAWRRGGRGGTPRPSICLHEGGARRQSRPRSAGRPEVALPSRSVPSLPVRQPIPHGGSAAAPGLVLQYRPACPASRWGTSSARAGMTTGGNRVSSSGCCSPPTRLLPEPPYHRPDHSDNDHKQWFDWPVERKRESGSTPFTGLLEAVEPACSTIEERLFFQHVILDRIAVLRPEQSYHHLPHSPHESGTTIRTCLERLAKEGHLER